MGGGPYHWGGGAIDTATRHHTYIYIYLSLSLCVYVYMYINVFMYLAHIEAHMEKSKKTGALIQTPCSGASSPNWQSNVADTSCDEGVHESWLGILWRAGKLDLYGSLYGKLQMEDCRLMKGLLLGSPG